MKPREKSKNAATQSEKIDKKNKIFIE